MTADDSKQAAARTASKPTASLPRGKRLELKVRLRCVDELCDALLADELCQQLAESRDADDDEGFVATVREIREACAQAIQFVDEVLSQGEARAKGGTSGRKSLHDFKNLLAPIKYGCQILAEMGDERFLPFEETIEEISLHVESCLALLAPPRASRRRAAKPRRAPAAAPSTETRTHEGPAERSCPEAPIGHVLVVDDDPANRDYLVRELSKQNHRVTAVEDGRQALELLDRHCYAPDLPEIDLVLLDLQMREVGGFKVLEEMKKDYGLRTIPVVIVSGQDDMDSVVRCVAAGADDYLTKPFDPRLLQARVASCLVKRHLRKQERVLSDQIHAAKLRADNLLYDIFPYTVAEELITSGAVKPRGCENVAVLFCDVVGFTPFCNQRPPDEVVARLHELFTAYEDAVRRCRVEKIKTIGDCMMITAGLMQRFENPVLNCLRCAEMMIAAARQCSTGWEVRVGIHVGPVVAGMAGNKQYAFDVWGDTVNTASRIERTAAPGTISVSEPAWARVYHACHGTSLGIQPLKGKDSMEVFRFEGFREEEA
jgi:class 3 adenylate cyclase/CheY-like chemotaxis protein